MSDLIPRGYKEESESSEVLVSETEQSQRKGPLSFFTGALTSGFLAWLCLGVSQRLVEYFTLHAPHYSSAIAQSAAAGFKTLVIGTSFLATFTFSFIGFGLTIVFFRSFFDGRKQDSL